MLRDVVGQAVAEREFILHLNDGESVIAEERFFLVRAAEQSVSRDHLTAIEIEVMTEHRWWSVDELTSTNDVIFPEGLVGILERIDHADTSAP